MYLSNLLLISVILHLTTPISVIEKEWSKFKLYHGRNYTKEENAVRRKLFKNNVIAFKKHNKLYEQKKVSYKLDTNCEILDKFRWELKFLTNVANLKPFNRKPTYKTFNPHNYNKTPSEVDWRQKGAVTSVKASGPCGSCYSFAAVGVLEAQYYIKHKKLVTLSAQQFLDCSYGYGNLGCDGGYAPNCFEYAKRHTITSDKQYPYTATDGACQSLLMPAILKVKKVERVKKGSEKDLLVAVAKHPVSVGVHSTPLLQCYQKGIFYDPDCRQEFNILNHAVLVVGYGEENGEKYWIVKNSWGTKWGEKGYARMARDRGNNCGIATFAYFATLDSKLN